MSLFDRLFPRPPDAPPPFPAVNDRNVGHWMDEGEGLFREFAGGRIEAETLLSLLHRLVDTGVGIMRGFTSLLLDGSMRLSGWFSSMLGGLVPRHFAAKRAVDALTRGFSGGVAATVDPEFIAQVNAQAGFLERFREQVASAEQLLDGTALSRAAMYAHSTWALGQNFLRARMLLIGQRMERRVLGHADHCRDCPPLAALGWQPVGTLPPIGATECMIHCKCHFTFM